MMPFTPYVAAAAVAVAALALALRRWAPAALAAPAAICLGAVHRGRTDPEGVVHLVDELHPDGIIEYEVEPLPGSDHRATFAKLALPGR